MLLLFPLLSWDEILNVFFYILNVFDVNDMTHGCCLFTCDRPSISHITFYERSLVFSPLGGVVDWN